MARKQVIDLDASQAFGFGSEKGQIPAGKEVAGYYIGSRKVDTSFGPSTLHVLKTATGNVGYFGSSQLNTKLSQITPGTMVFVTYLKKVKTGKGSMKTFNVEFDDEDTIEVGEVQTNFSQAEEPTEEESNELETSSNEETEQEASEDEPEAEEPVNPVRSRPAPAARPANRANADKVEALLKRNGR